MVCQNVTLGPHQVAQIMLSNILALAQEKNDVIS